MIIQRILKWLSPPLDTINEEIDQTTRDIAFLTNKIHVARRVSCGVIADKLIASRDKLEKKYERLLEKRRQLFNY